MKISSILGCIFVGALLPLAFLAGRATATTSTIDTLVVRDTVTRYLPQPIHREPIASEVAVLPRVVPMILPSVGDMADSVTVEVPMERVVYEEEDYRAVVEGFNPRLVEMTIYPKQTTIVQKVEDRSPIHLRVGPTLAWGWTPHGFDLCLGIGATLEIEF